MTDNETHRAKASGLSAGSQQSGQAGSCPYPFHNLRLRQAWLDGFSEGRLHIRQKPRDVFARATDPKRVTYALDLRCPQCGTAGMALASEIDTPPLGSIDFRLEAIPPGFHSTRQSKALGDTVILCTPCGQPAR